MKVVLLNTFHHSGGAAVAANRLRAALHKQGVDARLLVPELERPDDYAYAVNDSFIGRKSAFVRFAIDRLQVATVEKDRQVRFAFSPASIGIDLHTHPLVQAADILHLHWITFGFLSLRSIRQLLQLRKPIVWTLHDMWAFTGGCHYSGSCRKYESHCHTCPFLGKPHPKDISYRVFRQKSEMFSHANISFVACSQWLAGVARQSKLLQGLHVQAIPNPIDITLYQPIAKPSARKALSLPADKKLILFGAAKVADPRKGFGYLQQALQHLQTHYPQTILDVELVIFGKADELLAATLPFPVHTLGSLTSDGKLVHAYNAADVFVLPSLEDNLPNTVMESLACGTPVVAFDVGGVPEMVVHQSTGFVASSRSAEELAQGIYEALYNQTAQEWSHAARQHVLANYTEEVVANQYAALYRRLLSDGG